MVPKILSELSTPAFVINRHVFRRNCLRVSQTARQSGMKLRPHIKTHKTIEGALLQVIPTSKNDPSLAEVTGFVASTLPEVRLLTSAYPRYGTPFNDVLYGVPISSSKLPSIAKLNSNDDDDDDHPDISVHVMIDHHNQVDAIEDYVQTTKCRPFTAFLKLDTGYHRAGITDDERGIELAVRLCRTEFVDLKGIYSHCGHAYDTNSSTTLHQITRDDITRMSTFSQTLASRLAQLQIPIPSSFTVSVGSTPSAFGVVVDDDENPSNTLPPPQNYELHPGNYTMFDRQQLYVGIIPSEQHVACRILSRVIGHYEDRDMILLDAGATALTKDTTPQGGVCSIDGHPELECFKMSQEVIRVRRKEGGTTFFPFDEFPIGMIVALVPNHSCLAAACFEKYYVIEDERGLFGDEERIVEEWIPVKGW